MQTEEYITSKLNTLCTQRSITRYRLSKLTGLSQTALANILTGRTQPTFTSLALICDALGITLAQFFTVDGSFPDLSDEQKSLLAVWSALTAEKQELLLKFISTLNS